MMAALGDLLFGIPQRSTLNFLHDYSNMRLGAVLETDQQKLEVHRRKGTRNTLLSPDDTAISVGEAALTPFLANAGREFFERMFSLDHERLRRGGRAILDDRDEVGSMLFSAGSAIQDIQGRLRALDEEANGLWSQRRSAKRHYFKAADRLRQADTALRDHTVTASKWLELQRTVSACQNNYAEFEGELQGKETESRKLSRIRRVARYVREKAALDAAIAELGKVAIIPDDGRNTLDTAERDEMLAKRGLHEQKAVLERAKRARAALTWDDSLLLRGDDVDRLNVRRIQMQDERADLPKREAELAAAEERVRDLAAEFAWRTDEVKAIIKRIPLRAMVTQARAHLKEGLIAHTQVESTRQAVSEVETRLGDVKRQLNAAGAPADVSNLAALITATNRETGDIDSQIRAAVLEIGNAAAESKEIYRSMNPLPDSIEAAISMVVPEIAMVQDRRDARRELDQRLGNYRDQVRSAQRELARKQDLRERILSTEQPVPEALIGQLRSKRDKGWLLIRRRYIDGESVSDENLQAFSGAHPDLAAAYEGAVSEADATADRRFQTAEATARLSDTIQSVSESEKHLEMLQEELRELHKESVALNARWHEVWAGAEIDPLGPDEMLPWLTARADLINCVARHADADRRTSALRDQKSDAINQITSELRAVGVEKSPAANQGLRTILEFADEVKERHRQAAVSKHGLEVQIRKAEVETDAKRKDLRQAEAKEEEWRRQWSVMAADLGLDPTASPDAIGQQLDVIDEMRSVAAKAADLRIGRVGKIRRDLEGFERTVQTAVESIAPDLCGKDPDAAVAELAQRLAQAQQKRIDAETKDKDIAALEERIEKLEDERRSAADAILRLQSAAGAADIEGLRQEIEKVERLAKLESDRDRTLEDLLKEGDGLSIEDLVAECDGVDLDRAAIREDTLIEEAQQIRDRLMKARDGLIEARKAFEAVGGSDAAAVAETARQSALAEIRGVAEQYVRTRVAALILRWAIDRNRREKQGPLLREAGKLFAGLTSGSFENLEIDFDDQDQRRLVGRRPGGERVDVTGMSEGTMDQLYLAVRIAALEQYLESAQALPFVADDLFVNFDDERAAAGFRALGSLARRCQVIFFTHHQHLVDVAQSALPEPVRVLKMS